MENMTVGSFTIKGHRAYSPFAKGDSGGFNLPLQPPVRSAADARASDYRPAHLGLRFSRKAVIPSWASRSRRFSTMTC